MTTFVIRLGASIEADEVFHAWTSGDLSRMVDALTIRTNPIDRHFLLMNVVSLSYKRRTDPALRRLCREIGARHVAEFATIAPALAQDMGGTLPRVSTFAQLATVMAEDGDIELAVSVCESARSFGLDDGTKGGFLGRIARLRKRDSASKAARSETPSSTTSTPRTTR